MHVIAKDCYLDILNDHLKISAWKYQREAPEKNVLSRQDPDEPTEVAFWIVGAIGITSNHATASNKRADEPENWLRKASEHTFAVVSRACWNSFEGQRSQI